METSGGAPETMMADIPPSQTVYINNLNTKINKQEMKLTLYCLCSQYGPILDVVALKTAKMRGQAFIVFKEISAAIAAVRALQGFPLFDKPMRLSYAKSKSDAVAKLDGTFMELKKRQMQEKKAAVKDAAQKKQKKQDGTPAGVPAAAPCPTEAPKVSGTGSATPNHLLFVENLPTNTTDVMLAVLFRQFPGYKEVRLVPGKEGIAFAEFENEQAASVALNALNGYRIVPEHPMQISYAKR
eukprot:TRINITY_DN8267_c0_g1_i1.p2 TRINITY_DN8267_c0_g1~~TRINITY_DN8267_c0_g1_i1.p2  ORF type:complete len:250 (-),score=79.91 TRINITY_DN8267_c0_g1_i1:98-820(-)